MRRIAFENAVSLVTLEDPDEGPESARNAFARIRPPEDHSPVETAIWRHSVAAIARQVRVLPTRRSAHVAMEASRPGEEPVEGIREEAIKLAKEADDEELLQLVEKVLAESEKVNT